jgi:flagellar biosynthesis protein FlhG
MAKIITVTSGKGGVGKTNFSVNLAVWLAQKGFRTCLFDADLGLANINILMGIYPEHTLEDVIEGRKTIKEIVIKDKSGIDIIPGSSGVAKMVDLPADRLAQLAKTFTELDEYDYFIFDTSAGVSKNVIAFCMSSLEVILLITPEPTSLTDAYALLKILNLNGYKHTPKVVVNQSKNAKTAQLAYSKLKETTRKFLGIQLAPLGTIVSDPRVLEAVSIQKPFITVFPTCQAAKCIQSIAKHIIEKGPSDKDVFTLETFWNKCFNVFTGPLKMPAKKKEATAGQPPKADPSKTTTTTAGGEDAPQASPTTSMPAAATPGTDIPAPQASPAMIAGNQALLNQLVESVSSISTELAAIRQTIEKGALQGSSSRQTDGYNKGKDGTPIIPLDFEAFLAGQDVSSDAE